jgi:hypothetical protein
VSLYSEVHNLHFKEPATVGTLELLSSCCFEVSDCSPRKICEQIPQPPLFADMPNAQRTVSSAVGGRNDRNAGEKEAETKKTVELSRCIAVQVLFPLRHANLCGLVL